VNIASSNPTMSKTHDLYTAIPSWFVAASSFLHSFFSFNDLTIKEIVIIIYTAIGILIIAFLFIPGSKFFSGNTNNKVEAAELSYLLASIPLIFPMQQKHAFVFMTPLIIYVIHYLIACKPKPYQILLCTLAFFLMVLTTDGIIGRELNLITQHLKLVTIGGLIFIVLFFCIRYEEQKSTAVSSQ